jgi:CDP-archaeol synthase
VEAIWIFLPLIGGALAHAPVLRWNLLPALARPLDGGATFRGRRLFGANKTWRGALFMFGGTFVLASLLSRLPLYWRQVPEPIRVAGPWTFAALLGLATVLSELPNSFLKRQLDIPPGGRRGSPLGFALSLLDQGDFVFGVWALFAPIWVMSLAQAGFAFVVVAAVHLGISVVGFAIGARETVL